MALERAGAIPTDTTEENSSSKQATPWDYILLVKTNNIWMNMYMIEQLASLTINWTTW
jgi:hypothetical protein